MTKGFRQPPGGGAQLERQYQDAVELHAAGRIAEAEAAFAAILKKSPAHFGSLQRLGAIRRGQGKLEESLALLKRAIACNPGSADAYNSLANTLQALGRHEEAIDRYRRALAIRPEYPDAHNNLGNSYKTLGRLEEAAACYRQAIALRPGFEAAHSNLGTALIALRRPDEALACFETALAIRPGLGSLHSNLGTALMALNRHEEAAGQFRRALDAEPGLPQPQLNLAMARLALGDYDAWPDFEARWRSPDRKPREYQQPVWDGHADLAGKTVLLYCEQGLGDTMQFVRYAPLVAQRGERVILQVQKPLRRLMESLAGPADVIEEGETPPEFDFHAPLLSLPMAFQTTLASIPAEVPYLHAPPAANGGSIGLCWAGNPGYANDHNRSVPLPVLRPLLEVPGARFVGLQKNFRPGDEEILAGYRNVDVESDRRGADFADTAALVAGLDLVITVDTAVAHLAGALGRTVWILLPFSAHWAWLREREDSPWYPTARLFRQPRIGDWDAVVTRVAEALGERLSTAREG